MSAPYLVVAWKFVRDRHLSKDGVKIMKFPHRRCTWCAIGLAVALLLALVGSLVFLHHNNNGYPQAGKCYAKGTFDGLSIYLVTDHTTMQSCDSAAKGSGLANLSSLPPGVQQVCSNGTVAVYMSPVQIATVHDLGLNPATICS